jgi:hypothetical protein
VYDDYVKIHGTLYIGFLDMTRACEWLSSVIYVKFFRDGTYHNLYLKMQFLPQSKHTQPRL